MTAELKTVPETETTRAVNDVKAEILDTIIARDKANAEFQQRLMELQQELVDLENASC